MQDIFTLTDKGLRINNEMVMLYPSFNSIYKRDFTTDKKNAYAELTYIYIICDFKSPGVTKGYKGVKLHDFAAKFAKLGGSWKPDKHVNEAIEIYNREKGGIVTDLYKSILSGFNTSRSTIDLLDTMIADKIEELSANKAELNNEIVKALATSVKELIGLSIELPKRIDDIREVIKKVHVEQSNKQKARNDVTITASMNPKRL